MKNIEAKWGRGKRADVYLEVRKRRGHIFFESNKCLCHRGPITEILCYVLQHLGDETYDKRKK